MGPDHVRPDALSPALAAARERRMVLMARIVRHRELGADLVYEAHDVDIGASE